MTVQNGAYAANKDYWENITNTWIPGVPPIYSPIPGDDSTFQSFRVDPNDAADVPDDASIGDFEARWAWVIRRQLKVYRETWVPANPTIDIGKLLRGGYKSF